MPKAEIVLWSRLKSNALDGYKFRRQYSVGKFVIDFYCPRLTLAIEVDGDSHFSDESEPYDKARRDFIESFGISFLRFTNNEIYENLGEVLAKIENCMQKKSAVENIMLGSLLVHMTVNVINDYYDYVDGIDLNTQRTPFSGGSGVLPSNLLKPKQAFWFATICLLIAMGIGAYFVFTKGWLLFPLLLVAGFSAYFYNVYLSKWLVGELFAGLNFGPLLVLGAYYVQTGRYSWEALVASIAPGILTSNLLFLNEFPDREADQRGGRRHLVITLGKKNASFLFVSLIVASYLCIIIGVLTKMMPWMALIGLGTIGFGWKAAKGAIRYYHNTNQLVPGL
jgi:1,4-dihydroxy-2-naphthoate octaprenyltransferase